MFVVTLFGALGSTRAYPAEEAAPTPCCDDDGALASGRDALASDAEALVSDAGALADESLLDALIYCLRSSGSSFSASFALLIKRKRKFSVFVKKSVVQADLERALGDLKNIFGPHKWLFRVPKSPLKLPHKSRWGRMGGSSDPILGKCPNKVINF